MSIQGSHPQVPALQDSDAAKPLPDQTSESF